MNKLRDLYHRVFSFVNNDIWKIQISEEQRLRSLYISVARVAIISVRSFARDKVHIRASSLTYFLILSVVPMLAMIFGIAKGFGIEKLLERELHKAFEGQEEILDWSLQFAHSMLDTTQGGAIAGIGLLFLFWSIMKLMINIEDSFNEIWEIKKPRSYVRKFTDYFSIMLFSPILLILASSATVFITTQLQDISTSIKMLAFVNSFLFQIVKFVPYTLVWILFTLIYVIMPNTRVNFLAALVAGILAGTAFQLLQWGYINFQVGVSRYNTIYGSFAALPLFLIWVQLSWFIILFGAEISYATQNVNKYEFENVKKGISHSLRQDIALLIMHAIVKNFIAGKPPMNDTKLAEALHVPVRLISNIAQDLVKTEALVSAHTWEQEDSGYNPAVDPSIINIAFVVEKLNNKGIDTVPLLKTDAYNLLSQNLKIAKERFYNSPENMLLKDI